MIDSGIGETHINSVLSAIDIPPVCHKTLKKCERVVGQALEKGAKKSCEKFLEDECMLTSGSATNATTTNATAATPLSPATVKKYRKRLEEGYDCDDPCYATWKDNQLSNKTIAESTHEELTTDDRGVGITVAYDMGWQKRGRAMNSLTGVGANIGAKTGKIVNYATRSKRCITCEVALRAGRPPRPHDCRRNHFGSSKSMEPAVAVELAKDLESHGAYLACLVSDDDASTYKRVVEEVGDMAKHSDIGHVKRGLGSKLFEAKTRNKKCKQLSDTVIRYVQKMFAYALHTNAGDAEAVKQALETSVPHAYGDHSQCFETWCGYLKAPATYKHSGLPRGKDLTCPETRRVLTDLFGGLAAQAAKLAPLGSRQANESFNSIATSKAPKSRHYGGSDSQDFRIAAAVLQKNVGHQYVASTVHAAGWSPSTHALQRGKQIDAARAKQKAGRSTRKAKIQRRALRDTSGRLQDVSELREGVTYETACTLVGGDIDTEEIRAPVTKPTLHPLTCNQARTVIIFDLETTSLQRTAQLTHMAARVCGTCLYIQHSYFMFCCQHSVVLMAHDFCPL